MHWFVSITAQKTDWVDAAECDNAEAGDSEVITQQLVHLGLVGKINSGDVATVLWSPDFYFPKPELVFWTGLEQIPIYP